jgi:hypothetical protein
MKGYEIKLQTHLTFCHIILFLERNSNFFPFTYLFFHPRKSALNSKHLRNYFLGLNFCKPNHNLLA